MPMASVSGVGGRASKVLLVRHSLQPVDVLALQGFLDGDVRQEKAADDRRAALSEAVRARVLQAAPEAPLVNAPVSPETDAAVQGWSQADRRAARLLLAAEWGDVVAKRGKLEAELNHRRAELDTANEQIAKLEATLPMARQRERDMLSLSSQGFVTHHATQDRTRERIEMEKDLDTARAKRTEYPSAVAEAEQALVFRYETLRTLRDREEQAHPKQQELDQDVAKSAQRSSLATLGSPVTGTVQQLAVHTAGGVVTPAQPLLVVVPDHASVTAEIEVQNQDIGFIRVGQEASFKLESFEFTKYGTLHGTVSSVAADAVVQSDTRSQEERKAIVPARLNLKELSIGSGDSSVVDPRTSF
jgi:hemolysin D